MIRSMTGFARRELAGAFGTLVCEIRSVNHRFLDLTLRLPDSCRSLEPELRALLSQELRRGKVDATLQQRPAPLGALGLDIDRAALERLLERARELAAALPQHTRLDVMDLLRWPGVLHEPGLADEEQLAAARGLFRDTLSLLVGSREREGERLSATVLQRCTALGHLVAALRERLPEAQARIRARFAERLRELGVQVDPERMEQEIALMLQRFDIDEELDRLSGHLEETRRTLAAPEPAGRRLDFLMQELNREANTLSSKSQDLVTTRTAVDMKVLIEQMREQVQNVE